MQASLHLSGDPKCIWARTVVCIEAEAELLCRDAKHIEDGSDELLGGEELIVEEKGEHDSCQVCRVDRANRSPEQTITGIRIARCESRIQPIHAFHGYVWSVSDQIHARAVALRSKWLAWVQFKAHMCPMASPL